VRRIVLVRPAVEAGERLGFLPGDLAQKVDPYLRPMYDALYEMMGFDRVARNVERQVIEVAPLAFMRGRSLNDSFIILDEAQNTTVEQMKMFLTRLGFGSRAVVTGDITQIDLPRQQRSGLRHAIEVLRGVEGVAFTFFNSHDVVRHPLVQRIVQAYERAGDVPRIRLHGDVHEGNVLWYDGLTERGPHFVDFDDSRMGPAVQDLWMMLGAGRAEQTQRLVDLLAGYEDFAEFNRRELHLVEALRTLRLIHYAAWIARRWSDPAFPAAFPWFDTPRFWEARILELREQIAAMQDEPLVA